MNTSPWGQGGIPPTAEPSRELTIEAKLRCKLGTIADCCQRALDGLARDDVAAIDWWYVYKQIDEVFKRANDSLDMIHDKDDGDDEDRIDTPLFVETDHRDPFLPAPVEYPPNGGDA